MVKPGFDCMLFSNILKVVPIGRSLREAPLACGTEHSSKMQFLSKVFIA